MPTEKQGNAFADFFGNVSTAWKVLLPLLTALGVLWLRIDANREDMNKHFALLQQEIRELKMQQDTAYEDRFTLTMKAEDALRTAIANPGLRIPDPKNPGKYLQVMYSGMGDP